MKIIHIPAESTTKVNISKLNLKGRTGIVTTAQYLSQLNEFVKQVPNSVNSGQVLGCKAMGSLIQQVDQYLFVGTGTFHPVKLAINTGKPVYLFNPITNEYSELDNKLVEAFKRKQKAEIVKYLTSDIIGILVSTKSGQNKMAVAKKIAERKDKQYYIFAFETLLYEQLENFPFIQCWVNTACPRISDDKPNMVGFENIRNYYKQELKEEYP